MNDRETLERWVDRIVAIESKDGDATIDAKLDALGYLVDRLRRERKPKERALAYEDYIQGKHDVIDQVLFIVIPEERSKTGTGTSSIELEVPLLMFLLLYHRERYSILNIIDLFTERLSDQLKPVDYKRTSTGVIRCYTNTRFAAKRLRDYGLLRYTYKEAYKTWELSLVGLMVASVLLHRREGKNKPWQIPARELNKFGSMSQEIAEALDEVKDYGSFIERLTWICAPKTDLFDTFGPALKRAFGLLPEYRKQLLSPHIKETDRRKLGPQFIRRLEQEGIDDKFHEEFSQCIQINELVRKQF